ncbi:MAG: type II toxin-antitoxin system Phd/YefM family antitoxin [Betaproteobacteria bacterium]
MTKTYSVADARARLPDILDEVETGKEVQLTRRGRPVAVVVSPRRYDALRNGRASFAEAYRAFLGRQPGGQVDLDAEFFDSLRDRGTGRAVRL